MILQFMTARNAYGHRKYLEIDTDRKVYATETAKWLSLDIPVIKSKDLNALIDKCVLGNYTRLDYL